MEEKIYRTIELLKAARIQKAVAEAELASMRDLLDAQAAETEALRKELQSVQRERLEVRVRVEKLLGEVDAILESSCEIARIWWAAQTVEGVYLRAIRTNRKGRSRTEDGRRIPVNWLPPERK